jgi:uncharacterized protein
VIKLCWTGLAAESTETCVLDETVQGIHVKSTVHSNFGSCGYTLIADRDWQFQSLTVTVEDRSLRTEYDGVAWIADGAARPDLDAAREVDIAVTPLTNSLPIRRLGLDVGQSADIVTAYVAVPELTVVADPQRYTRLTDDQYRYQSLDSDFARTIIVDELGLVLSYPGLFVRTDG